MSVLLARGPLAQLPEGLLQALWADMVFAAAEAMVLGVTEACIEGGAWFNRLQHIGELPVSVELNGLGRGRQKGT